SRTRPRCPRTGAHGGAKAGPGTAAAREGSRGSRSWCCRSGPARPTGSTILLPRRLFLAQLCYNVYMPRYVDETARRRLIAEATMRLVAADGLQAASVRRIADEAGLSMGSLRHYLRSQDELIVYTMRLIRDRVRDRIQASCRVTA